MSDSLHNKHIDKQINETKNEDSSSTDINLLREKTFNEDLKKLVSRITRNEDSIAEDAITHDAEVTAEEGVIDEIIKERDVDFIISAKDLILQYHILFYQIKNLSYAKDVNTVQNIFNLDSLSFNTLMLEIEEQLKRIDIHEIAIFRYSFDSMCYQVFYNGIKGLVGENSFLSILDPFFDEIHNAKDGIYLDSNEINTNAYLQTKFSIKMGLSTKNLFFIQAQWLFRHIFSELEITQQPMIHKIYPYDIIIIPMTSNKKITADVLKSLISVPCLLLQSHFQFQDLTEYPKAQKYSYLEYILHMFSKLQHHVGYFLVFSKNIDKDIFYINKYIKKRLFDELNEQATIITMGKDKSILFFPEEHMSSIEMLLQDYEETTTSIYFESFTAEDCKDMNSIIQKVISI